MDAKAVATERRPTALPVWLKPHSEKTRKRASLINVCVAVHPVVNDGANTAEEGS